MYGVAARVWNQVAKEQPLQTGMARSLFPLSQDKLNEALEARELALQQKGVEPRVASAYLTVAPLLWEKAALAAYSRDHPGIEGALPEVVSPAEATLLATKEFSLTESQQRTLQQQLMTPPT